MDTSRWTTTLSEITTSFQSDFSHLTHEQLNWRPNARTWSIAQILTHLMAVNESYFPVIDSIRKGTYQIPLTGKWRWLVDALGKMILQSVKPETKRKTITLPIWEPGSSHVPEGILGKFANHQLQLVNVIQSSADLLDRRQVISSPANRRIVYTLELAFEIITVHEQRHLNQARELALHIKA